MLKHKKQATFGKKKDKIVKTNDVKIGFYSANVLCSVR